ncbi:M20/M25/M40 family metallo-hydrolase [Bacillus sp. PS06]|uniref:M20/M25/M40 family metallo-hydrolase n=1 Tax=Bacillus sp. PS06 TaxID=2764176 RepID=UPI0017836FC0|nr:M20/M25/M40 family metallo-hydrolase [Bacillus sp. PS06]MBD8068713.1 M20/M25/M40 family metallo-hydrolase [Bacillus sp. PS06]
MGKDLILSEKVENVFQRVTENVDVKEALAFLKEDNDRTAEEQIEITTIPAPTFAEDTRGADYKKRLEQLGIQYIKVDDVGNVFGIRPGSGNGPTLVVCAHLDTVFPEGTDTVAKRVDGKIYAPGISDDGRGLAVVLTLIRALNHAGIETEGDLVFGATVGEEGLGDLRGVKELFKDNDEIDGFISIEPGDPERITYLGTGSARYQVTYKGPGGHSFGNFGTPSTIHALGRAIAMISQLETPAEPKTTFNVGMINGGTSVNTIAEEASMLVDLRSNSQEELEKLDKKVLHILQRAADEENERWQTDVITVDVKRVGDRPAGSQRADAAIVQASVAASKSLGFEGILGDASSTDSNVPIFLGIPAVTLGGGGDFGGVHTLNEYFDPTDSYFGAQKIFLTMMGLVGVKGVSEPLLEKRKVNMG